jgi:predicted enzyme related to lactoylglutathione lyase
LVLHWAVEDFEGTVAALRKNGVEVTGAKPGMDHSWQAWIQDPDGNRIELHAYTPESWQFPSPR